MKKTVRNILVVMLAAVLLVGLSSCSKNESHPDQAKANTTNTAQTSSKTGVSNFTVSSLSGESYQLTDFKGKVLIVDFWDTWCPPCRKEIPHFIELYNEYNGKGLEILGVAFGRNGTAAVQQFIDEYKIPYKNAMANDQIMSVLGPIRSIPTTYVIDQKGQVVKKYIGYNDKSVFETDIKALLSK